MLLRYEMRVLQRQVGLKIET